MGRIVITYVVLIGLALSGCKVTESVQQLNDIKNSKEKSDYIYTEATRLKLLGEYDKSIRLFKDYLKLHPESAATYYQLAQLASVKGDLVRSAEFIDEAIKLDKENEWYTSFAINIYKNQNNLDKVIQLIEDALKINPDNDELKYELAMYLAFAKKYDKSLQIVNSLEDEYGISEELSIQKYELYVNKNEEDSAILEIKKLIEFFPDRVNYYGIIAEHYLNKGNYNIAKGYYDKLLELDSVSIEGRLSYGKYLIAKRKDNEAKTLYTNIFEDKEISSDRKLSVVVDVMNNPLIFQEGKELIKFLIEKYVEVAQIDKDKYTLWADYYLKSQQIDKSLSYLKKLLVIDSSNYFFWEQVILIENQFQNHDSVTKYATEAIRRFPEYSNLYLIGGVAHFQLGEFVEAKYILEKGKKINTRNELNYQFHLFLAETYNALKEYDKSDKLYRYLIQVNPGDYATKNNYAYYLSLREKDLKLAKEYSEETIKAFPNNPTYLDTYAWILYKMGKYKEAYKYISKAILNGGDKNVEVLEHCADICIKLKQYDDAIFFYKKALELDPNNQEIHDKLKLYEK
jgi:tetratricopeptide (TPR) repeat protein